MVLSALTVFAIGIPHVLKLANAHAPTAALVWFLALCLRALVAMYAAIFVIFFMPATVIFQLVTHWCWHTAVPLLTAHLGFSGHSLGELALLAPILGLAASMTSVCFGLWRAGRTIRRWISRTSIGPGPHRSLIVGEHDVVIAAAGVRRPQVIVSAGALTTLDDEELDAGLAHEHGHIARRHRFVLVGAEVCRALARFLPGTRHAVTELVFHLERDADRWAVSRHHDPRALASAICKAAQRRPTQQAAVMTLSGGSVTRRVVELLHCDRVLPPSRRRTLDLVAISMVGLAITLSAALPAASLAGVQRAGDDDPVRHCAT